MESHSIQLLLQNNTQFEKQTYYQKQLQSNL